MPSYKDHVLFRDTALKVDSFGNMSISANELRYKKFIQLIKRWNIKKDNQEVLLTEENLGDLNEVLAFTVADELDRILEEK